MNKFTITKILLLGTLTLALASCGKSIGKNVVYINGKRVKCEEELMEADKNYHVSYLACQNERVEYSSDHHEFYITGNKKFDVHLKQGEVKNNQPVVATILNKLATGDNSLKFQERPGLPTRIWRAIKSNKFVSGMMVYITIWAIADTITFILYVAQRIPVLVPLLIMTVGCVPALLACFLYKGRVAKKKSKNISK